MEGGGTDRLPGDKGDYIITGGMLWTSPAPVWRTGVDAIIALGGNDNITKDNFGTVNIADNSTDGVSCGGRTRHYIHCSKRK